MAPGMAIVNAVAQGERVAGADNPDLMIGRGHIKIFIIAKALRVRFQIKTGTIHIFDIDIRGVDPSQPFIILSMGPLCNSGVVGDSLEKQDKAGQTFNEKQEDKDNQQVNAEEDNGFADFIDHLFHSVVLAVL
jgi:hypothetical protein